jgi:ABC-type oligopeptide transport system ATPase subunit
MDKILQVKNLKISFRTSSGTLKAVRNISFDLERGKTLAIVGESGSGKSVTSKAVLGILAGNSIVEGGEILYDGRDLLKISEEEMCTIRGNRISMIFQDPLSSLNPIVKIGRQITEAMLLKNKSNRRSARNEFNSKLSLLKKHMMAACGDSAKVSEMCKTFDRFNIEAIKMENSYNIAYGEADSLLGEVHDFLFLASKNQRQDVKASLKVFFTSLRRIKDPFLTKAYDAKLAELTAALHQSKGQYRPARKNEEVKPLPETMIQTLEQLEEVLKEICAQSRPNFFRIGYYRLTNPNEDLSGKSVDELNEMTLTYLDDHFMLEFLGMIAKGLEHAELAANEKKAAILPELEAARDFYAGDFGKKAAESKAKNLAKKVEGAIDRLDLNKDSAMYSFRTAMATTINAFFSAKRKNPKEEARFARQTKRREKLIAKGRTVDWKVVPKTVYDLDELKAEIVAVLDRAIASCKAAKVSTQEALSVKAVAMVDHFKACASEVVYKVTRHMAKERAIKLMAEVGIA